MIDTQRRQAIRVGGLRGRAIDAALRMVETRGPVGANLRDLARDLGTGPASLYHHFVSKDALMAELGMARSTLRRLGLGKLSNLDPKPEVIRYERSAPGEMIHLDIKKLGRFDIEGRRITGDRRKGSSRGAGWDFLHVCVDDASRWPTPRS